MRSTLFGMTGVLLVACTSEDSASPSETGRDSGSSEDSAAPTERWSIQPVDVDSGGILGRIQAPSSGELWVAYFNPIPREDGLCEEVEIDPPPKTRYELRFATRDTNNAWTTEMVDEPVVAFSPNGLDLTVGPDGVANVAYTGGEPSGQYCGSNDAYVAVNDGSWSATAVATESNQSATGNPASDAGFVVGLWPSLAFDSQGNPAVLHKDAHFGSLQRDDAYRADAELAINNGGGWDHIAVDFAEGAGDYGTLLFDSQDRPVAIYAVAVDATQNSRLGYWAARLEGETWNRVRLSAGLPLHKAAAGFDPVSGDLVVAFYSVDDQAARIRRLSTDGDFGDVSAWSDETVASNRFDEGRDVSLAFRADGTTVLAYHRCVLLSDASGDCNINDEALIIAEQGDSGWTIEEVHAVQGQSCGRYAAIVIDDQDRAHISFTCDGNGLFVASEEN